MDNKVYVTWGQVYKLLDKIHEQVGSEIDLVIRVYECATTNKSDIIVVICGDIMTMPGLPSVPAANSIKLNTKGEIEGLF